MKASPGTLEHVSFGGMNERLVGAPEENLALESVSVARDRPWLFGLLIAPSAVVANGIIQGGVLGYLLSQHGVGSDSSRT